MKIFNKYRYARSNLLHKLTMAVFTGFLLQTGAIRSAAIRTYEYPFVIPAVNNENSKNFETTKKRKKKSRKKKTGSTALTDLESIGVEEFRKLEVRLLEKESKLKSYEPIAPDVTFTVQIFASENEIDPAKLKKIFGLNTDLSVEFAKGLYKYTAGKFIKYWKAREFRKVLISKYFIYDAFVVAHQAGERVALNTLVPKEEWEKENSEPVSERLLPVKSGKYSIRFLKVKNVKISVDTIKEIYGYDEDIYCQYENGWYHYIMGVYNTYNEAAKARNKLRMEGNTDALVIGEKLLFQKPTEPEISNAGNIMAD